MQYLQCTLIHCPIGVSGGMCPEEFCNALVHTCECHTVWMRRRGSACGCSIELGGSCLVVIKVSVACSTLSTVEVCFHTGLGEDMTNNGMHSAEC